MSGFHDTERSDALIGGCYYTKSMELRFSFTHPSIRMGCFTYSQDTFMENFNGLDFT